MVRIKEILGTLAFVIFLNDHRCIAEQLCKDDPNFLFENRTGKDCNWAGNKPDVRCNKFDSKTTKKVYTWCPDSCGKCSIKPPSNCADEPDFRFKNVDRKSCTWVSKQKKKKRKKICKKKTAKKNCPLACGKCSLDIIKMPSEEPSQTPTKAPSQTPTKASSQTPTTEVVYPCGCSTCTDSILNTFAGKFKCGDRINFLRNERGFSEEKACEQVANTEFPKECGGCNPNRCIESQEEDEEEELTQKCGGAVNSSNDSHVVCQNDLWTPTNDSTMYCFAYGGSGDPCHLNNNNDFNDGLDKNPSLCHRGDTFYLWDEPDTQGKSYAWAGTAWYEYSRTFSTQLAEIRSNGIKITSPLLKAGGPGVLAGNLADFFQACGEACNNPNDPAYIDVIAVNAFCGDFNGPSRCRGGAAFIYNESRSMSTSNGNRPVYVTNWSRLGSSDPRAQVEAMDAIDEFFPVPDGVVERVYWFGATDFGGNSNNNFLSNTLFDGSTLGEYWTKKCKSLR